jgi:hypothetical protein
MYDAAIAGDKLAGKAAYAARTSFPAKLELTNQSSQY